MTVRSCSPGGETARTWRGGMHSLLEPLVLGLISKEARSGAQPGHLQLGFYLGGGGDGRPPMGFKQEDRCVFFRDSSRMKI